tara:strand:+ start:2187 stop:2780 length:594 start_codon:yes stop_codon:yes gene_type:complete
MMKNSIVIVFTVFICFFSFSQETKTKNLIQLDSTWGKEIFPFPISFAKNINYTGIAEVRFPPKGWRTPEHSFFWSYTYAWFIDYDKKISAKQLKTDLENYFDGLNDVRKNHNINQKTTSEIQKIRKKNTTTFFEGKVDTYDHFATHKRLILNVKIKSNYCKKTNKTVILFTFSPKEFTHKVWDTLNKIKLKDNVCFE